MPHVRLSMLLALSMFFVCSRAIAQSAAEQPAWLPAEARYDKPFFDGGNYDPQIPTPKQLLGYELGSRPASHAEIERCLKAWDEASQRMTVTPFGQTNERRTQYYATITSTRNQTALGEIRAAIGKLADPRKLKDQAEADRIIRDTPAIAWGAYCIHGDEMSGSDAALAVIYHLVAARDRDTEDMLDKLVICIDPIQNPDGRDRFIRRVDEFDGATPVLDRESIQHQGVWPYGRTNHYQFDLNRDWIYAVQPETRNRQRVVSQWMPQLFIDSHEMDPTDTFLFNPAREPFNPGLSPMIRKWWNTFANDAGTAFDQHGWSYYSREWADFWYPGYSDGWACMHGAIGILYEQARTGGRSILLPTGRILTYREAVHHQAVCSMSNLNSLLRNRTAVLTDYLANRRAALAGNASQPQTFILPPSANRTRTEAFVDYLTNQGVEVTVASQAFDASDLLGTSREKIEKKNFPAGTILVQRRQPLAPLVGAILDFDPRMDKAFLESERKELETKRSSRLYDITGWSVPMAWNLDAYWSTAAVSVASKPYAKPTTQPATADVVAKPYAYVIDVADDSWRRCLVHLMMAGVQVRVADREFRAAGRSFQPGSLLIRRHDNDEALLQKVLDAAKASGATIHAATTARSPDDTPDLGGQHMLLLTPPRVALLSGSEVDTTIFGATWHMLDRELGLPVSLFSTSELARLDLRRHNVLILPGAEGTSAIQEHMSEIETFMRAGGTVIAIEGATSLFTGKDSKLSAVRDRVDILKSDKESLLDEYASAVALERAEGKDEVDADKLWDEPAELLPLGAEAAKPDTKLTREALDEWRRLFSPTGVIVRGEVCDHHWMSLGCPRELPLYYAGSRALLSKSPTETVVRLAPPQRLRLSGLLWPEAAQRLGDAAYATAERVGSGQLILFASDVNFRGAYRGANQLLINAVLLGPGCGTSQAVR